MAHCRERSLPAGRGPSARPVLLLGSLLVIGCASKPTSPDVGPGTPDAAMQEDQDSSAAAPNLDAKIGLGGGSWCDASEQCLSGACTLGVCSDWANAMRIGIDTTATGADVNEDVAHFPLLVRLNATNFNFDGARHDGADIRFLDAGGNNLDYEVERWDADGAVAEIWVLVPRISGNSLGNFIFMYWGNPLSAPISDGPSVFGDFMCVFHMGESPSGSATQIDDGSGHNNTGFIQTQSAAALRGGGISGTGLALDGTSTYLATSLPLGAPQTVAISVWLKTTSATGGGIATFAGNKAGAGGSFDHAIAMDAGGRLSFAILHGGALATVTSLASYNDGAWHFIVARFSSSGQYLFVDGEAVADDPMMTSADAHSGYWRFGEEPAAAAPAATPDAAISTGYFISGTIDEIRVTAEEPSDARIKLCYATQRPGASAVVYPARP